MFTGKVQVNLLSSHFLRELLPPAIFPRRLQSSYLGIASRILIGTVTSYIVLLSNAKLNAETMYSLAEQTLRESVRSKRAVAGNSSASPGVGCTLRITSTARVIKGLLLFFHHHLYALGCSIYVV